MARTQDDDLYEVMVLPHDPDIRKEVDIRINTFAKCPERALDKVKRHLEERGHFAMNDVTCDFVIHKRLLVE